jgi:hypothetical protein
MRPREVHEPEQDYYDRQRMEDAWRGLAKPFHVKLAVEEEFAVYQAMTAIAGLIALNKNHRPFLRKTAVDACKLAASLLDDELSDPAEMIDSPPF